MHIELCKLCSTSHFLLLLTLYVWKLSREQIELESIRSEYTNAQLECNAADERAKLLASEVIGLEEKVVNFFDKLSLLLFAV